MPATEQTIGLVSLRTGRTAPLLHNGKAIPSAIVKEAAAGPLALGFLGFEGDEQADRVHHGGEGKAVCVYPSERYDLWNDELKAGFGLGAFGENVSTRGLLEEDVYIGDTFRIGTAVVQVNQPRQPCFKLAARHGIPDLPIRLQQTGYTGFYWRVLEEGMVRPDSGLERLDRDPLGVTVAEANRIRYRDKSDRNGILRVLAVDALSATWRTTFESLLASLDAGVSSKLEQNRQ
ncbi:MOSC domain-containing protein [Paenibacillus sp. J31TS4]|uniref:MOSC domain-containing protein n=1 Tax=Paenibacillus sp. J31TS4 TaxID=2807195 RepID=UPI001B28EA96|nr:MOSC domain-containing protein [Paenibacillus sp. J31TS4]GIP37665.1 MOSC domain-containing protein [Paenibacillus sp. J31TS4]